MTCHKYDAPLSARGLKYTPSCFRATNLFKLIPYRPYIIVKKGRPNVTKKHIDELIQGVRYIAL